MESCETNVFQVCLWVFYISPPFGLIVPSLSLLSCLWSFWMGYVLRDGENYFLFLALVTHKHFDLEIVSFPNQDENLGKKKSQNKPFFFFSSLQRKVTLKKSKLYLGYCSCLLAASGFSKCVSCLESRRVGWWGYQMPYAGSHKAKREKKKKVRKNKIFHRKLKLWGKWNFHHEKVLSRNVTVLRTTYESHFWSPLCGFSSLLSSSRLLLDERTFPKYGPDGTYILVYFYIISTSLSGDWGPRIHLFASPHCLIHGLLWSICKVTGPSPFKTLGRSISALTCRRNQPYGYG